MADLTQGTVLYGMMGSGKTTLGEGLAAHFDQPFVDTDHLIEAHIGATCADLVADPARDFAAAQSEAILGYEPDAPAVIATGGSVARYPELVDHLGRFGVGIFLFVEANVLETRLSPERIATLNNPNNLSFEDLLNERNPYYLVAADLVMPIRDGETPDTSLGRLIELRDSGMAHEFE